MMYEALSYKCMRLRLRANEAFSYYCMRHYATSACGLNYKLLVYAKEVACSAVDVKPSHSIRRIRIRIRRIRVTERLCEC